MSLRKAVLQRITPLPSRTPSPNIPADWPQPLLEEADSHQAASPVDEQQHFASRAKTPDLLTANGVVKRWRVNITDPTSAHPNELTTVASLGGTVNRDPELWWEDGNIILLCRDTAFRMYRGLLARQSVIFRDLFAMAQPSNSETMESCPVVHISDSPDDLRHLLRALCGLRKFPIIPGERMEFAELAALIRMSYKYHVEDVHSRSMHHLKLYFTNDLSTWDSAGADGNLFVHITPPDAIAAVNLARLTHADSVLPTALYLCCQLDQELNLGVERADGSVERLEPRDLELVLRARTELVRASTRGACTICRPTPSAQCASKGCERALREILGMMLDGLQKDPIGDIAGFAALDSWEHWIEDVVELWPLCEPCRAMLHARDLDVRKDVWKRLPSYMGVAVEDWKDPTAPVAPAAPKSSTST
ncbi:hypothetical protein BD309DRAFT_1016669 [Dichomitus squalens]|uniref:Uncharacterized protein n=1 Tax=Dichomitus squalens TaxID=114155 RepID=A0A4Q9P4P5_9APHY|nr:uncharacterized protein DICSQDRAFT_104017 [Dichomitus squalens LYAD-421 SS1]EJF62583.1 hypothetical protein DICSQDRAFT_104017 [Dichomitus squalens LYAD-421 SS1]TBU46976.1 hypothetical protein BD309DRAFT_1016669 [Dichomitus squalens]TBU60686.1 hypothetical protein BD310DRAFT_847261 [Dichomitus squalens]